jgi:hypothetical protein
MSQPLVIITPDNTRVNMSLVANYAATAATVVFSLINGTATITAQCGNAQSALNVVTQIDFAVANGLTGNLRVTGNGILITACLPTKFVAIGGGTVLNLQGSFTPDIVNGLFHVEDIAGGMDDNGFTFTPAYIDPNNATATWASNGDSTVGNSMIYYKDSSGNYSNALNGLVTS